MVGRNFLRVTDLIRAGISCEWDGQQFINSRYWPRRSSHWWFRYDVAVDGLVASNFEGRDRGLALGILGSIIGMSSASGPLIGGYLVEHFGWPSIFYVNVPFGIIAVILTVIYVKETPSYGKNQKSTWWACSSRPLDCLRSSTV